MTTPVLPPLAAAIGIDWADDHHDIALQALDGTDFDAPIETHRLPHSPDAIATWLAALATRFAGRAIGIAIETSRGPLVHALLEAPFVILYPVNPRSLKRFREVFSPNGAKDDLPDARLLLTLLVRHREQLRPWPPEGAALRELRALCEYRRAAVALQTQLTQRLQATLKEYFPHALTWAGEDLASPMACHFLQRWPTLEAVQRVRAATLRRFYTTHHCRHRTRIDARLAEIPHAVPLTRDAAILASRVPYVQLLTTQLLALAPQLTALDDAIAACFARQPDAALFASFPGAGAVFAPRLAAALGTDRSRFSSADDLARHTGIAPITVRSGHRCQVQWRWATSTFLRQTFHEFAWHSRRHCAWARAFYAQQRQRGKSKHVALRALAFKWLRILWRCWQDRVPYDTARYERALALRHSPLSPLLASPGLPALENA
jgi:transposase